MTLFFFYKNQFSWFHDIVNLILKKCFWKGYKIIKYPLFLLPFGVTKIKNLSFWKVTLCFVAVFYTKLISLLLCLNCFIFFKLRNILNNIFRNLLMKRILIAFLGWEIVWISFAPLKLANFCISDYVSKTNV